MSDVDNPTAVMRLGAASFMIPLLVLGTGVMFYAGRWKIGILFLCANLFFGYLTWRSVQRVDGEDNPNDERTKELNTHAAASTFWTIFNLGMLSFIAHMIFGINLNTLLGAREQIITVAPGLFIGCITLLYFGFRAYYKNFEIDSKFWRLD